MHDSADMTRNFRFGPFELDGRAHELRKDGEHPIRLQDQPYQILRCLLEQPGEVVNREELRKRVWPSSVFVDFDHGLNNAISLLRDALGDAAANPRYIQTLPRLGYRFIASVERINAKPPVAQSIPEESASDTPPVPLAPAATAELPRSRDRRLPRFAAATALLAIALLLGIWVAQRSAETPEATDPLQTPSIAVLPFANLSEGADGELFADGLSEELLDKLAGIRGLKVAGRSSSFYFKGKDVSPREIARELHVNHFLEGSVRRAGSRVRVTVQLLNAHSGFHLWSKTYDREMADIFKVQEDIAYAVATALRLTLVEADRTSVSARGTNDSEAYRLYVIGIALSRGPPGSGKDPARALEFFQAALARDPAFADAQAGIALTYFKSAALDLNDIEHSAREGMAAAEAAVALNPASSDAHLAKANFEFWRYRFRGDVAALARAREEYQLALDIEPTNAFAYFAFARAMEWIEPPLAARLYEQAANLDPLSELALPRSALLLSRKGKHDEARQRLQELDAQSLTGTTLFMAYLDRNLGQLDDAAILLGAGAPADLGPVSWSVHQTLGDDATAREALRDYCCIDPADALREAALFSLDGRNEDAFQSLERHRQAFSFSRVLDLPAARFALIAGQNGRAREILEERLPDLAGGTDSIKGSNVMPALDLAFAYTATGRVTEAQRLITSIAAFLDGPDAPKWPMFTYLRARTHVLAGERELALQALDRAFDDGFRLLWALDLQPGPHFYVDPIDADPVFAPLRGDERFKTWRQRIAADNARQLKLLRDRRAAAAAE